MLYTASYTHIGGREENEDTVRISRAGENRLCLLVADGLGGHGGGRLASFAAAEAVLAGWKGEADAQKLKDLVQEAHRRVQSMQTRQCAMKSTIAVLTLAGNRAAWAHAGDSRIYRFHRGKLEFQTKDHSASQIAVLMGDITQDQIRFHQDRNHIIRALGQDGELKVDADELLLDDGFYAFLLCSDGFWEYVLESEMEADLRAASDPEDWLGRMRARLQTRIPEDNDNNTAAAVWII